MFEKEAEEATLDLYGSADDVYGKEDYKQGFQDGAEFGYNKASEDFTKQLKEVVETCNHWQEVAEKVNKWHYVKDGDLPNTEFGRADVTVAYINAYQNPCKMDCCFDGTNFVYWDDRKPIGWKKVDIFGKIYAWKYLEKLPELPKESE